MNISIILAYLYPGINFLVDVRIRDDGNGPYISEWNMQTAQPTEAELIASYKPAVAALKREEIMREQEIRSATVWGKEVDRHMFAWIEEFYTAILKVSARNNITEAGAPITFGLKQLRDNRDTLLNGLDTWVNDPLKTADDIAGFDVVGWAGWTVARP